MIQNKIERTHQNKTKTYEQGQFYSLGEGDDLETYILSRIDNTDNGFCLISLEEGNRWTEPKSLSQIVEIIKESKFELVTSKFTIIPGK